MRTWMRTCPKCKDPVTVQADGTLHPHYRYADGAGYGPGQSHELIECEGSGT
jgi:hypothetical protein